MPIDVRGKILSINMPEFPYKMTASSHTNFLLDFQYDDLSINRTKTGEQPGIASVKSSTKGMAFGNILFGGVIGVDTATGAAYDYPTLITVQLGSTITITPLAKDKMTATSMTPPGQTAAPKTTAAAQ
jgi:hypothetical protein